MIYLPNMVSNQCLVSFTKIFGRGHALFVSRPDEIVWIYEAEKLFKSESGARLQKCSNR